MINENAKEPSRSLISEVSRESFNALDEKVGTLPLSVSEHHRWYVCCKGRLHFFHLECQAFLDVARHSKPQFCTAVIDTLIVCSRPDGGKEI